MFMAPFSQRLEPPQNPGRFTNACGNRTETSGVGLNKTNLGSVTPGLSCSSSAQNEAAPGQVRISALSSVNGAAAYGESKTNSTAQFAIDDLFITGPAGSTASGVMRLNVDGILNLSTSVSGTQPGAFSYAYWGLRIDSSFDQGFTNRNERVIILDEDGNIRVDPPVENSFGVLKSYQGGIRIVDLAFSGLSTNTNRRFVLTVTSESQAVAGGCVDLGCNSWTAGSGSTINFMNTVSLVEGQAAFVFDQAGFLANSASLNLRDNVWQGVVPLPGAALLFSSGLLGLVAITRRKKAVK
jgi:hypothetical protein